jgi:uncharacterized protein YbjT (DUF2867 family)
MTRTVLVTAGTGTVGRHVVAELAGEDVSVRAGTRDPGAAGDTLATDASPVEFDFQRPETWGTALDGVETLFLVRPPSVDTNQLYSFVDAAERVGVDLVVYLSALGAEKNVLIPHHRIERHIRKSSMHHVLLRASFFMQNLHEVHVRDIVERDEIFVPAGNGTTSFVDARDVGAVGARTLVDPPERNVAYDLTGPEALSYYEVAEIFSEVLDRPIRYPRPSIFDFVSRMRSRGEPLGFVLLMVGIYTTARLGLADRVTGDFARILDRDPRDFETYVSDYADEFRVEGV